MTNISAYIVLIIAVILGTAANGFAKGAQGFTILFPSVVTAITIVLCMYALSMVMKNIPMGITYASFALVLLTPDSSAFEDVVIKIANKYNAIILESFFICIFPPTHKDCQEIVNDLCLNKNLKLK